MQHSGTVSVRELIRLPTMRLNRKFLFLVSLALLVFGLRFVLEAAFPSLSEKFGETNTIAGVIALFTVAIVWKLTGSNAKETDPPD